MPPAALRRREGAEVERPQRRSGLALRRLDGVVEQLPAGRLPGSGFVADRPRTIDQAHRRFAVAADDSEPGVRGRMRDGAPGRAVQEAVLPDGLQIRPREAEHDSRLHDGRRAQHRLGAGSEQRIGGIENPGDEVAGQRRFSVASRQAQRRRVDPRSGRAPDEPALKWSEGQHGSVTRNSPAPIPPPFPRSAGAIMGRAWHVQPSRWAKRARRTHSRMLSSFTMLTLRLERTSESLP